MTLDQLLIELDELKTPLLVKRSDAAMQRVFDLYRIVAGRPPRGSGCYMCAVDAYYEMKRISQIGEGWDNSVNLPDTLIIKEPKLILRMEKYKMTRHSFRAFGSPDTITEENTSDEQVEALLKATPALAKYFVLRETGEAVKPKNKGGRPSKEQKEAEAKAAAEAEAARAEVAALEAKEAEEAKEKAEKEAAEAAAKEDEEKAAEVETIKVEVTEQHLEENPELVEAGVKVGDEIELPVTEETTSTEETQS